MSGKGDARRPAAVPRETMDANWARTFGAATGDKTPWGLPAGSMPADSQPSRRLPPGEVEHVLSLMGWAPRG